MTCHKAAWRAPAISKPLRHSRGKISRTRTHETEHPLANATENPREDPLEKRQYVGLDNATENVNIYWRMPLNIHRTTSLKSTMISAVSISGVQSFAKQAPPLADSLSRRFAQVLIREVVSAPNCLGHSLQVVQVLRARTSATISPVHGCLCVGIRGDLLDVVSLIINDLHTTYCCCLPVCHTTL